MQPWSRELKLAGNSPASSILDLSFCQTIVSALSLVQLSPQPSCGGKSASLCRHVLLDRIDEQPHDERHSKDCADIP